MVEGLHVIRDRVLQLMNELSMWGRCFQIQRKKPLIDFQIGEGLLLIWEGLLQFDACSLQF